ncbi:NnrU family protein [Pikeienuella piscinae]|uniref:NnrU family protein n=2 Tax=Pikeienuella piscinae TaxID=2748098 RepID=A0A7M3T6W4_9RHOB|nr:NnrU family protein [Pikeienuella piscinae]
MMDWIEFIAVFTAFYVLHSVPVRPPMRPWLVARLGHAGFGVAYSFVSLAMLVAVFVAAARAPFVLLWPEPPWADWLVLAAMFTAGLILGLGLFRPNPFSFGGRRNAAFDPQRPGVLRYLRHPVLAAFLLWAAAHLVVNGDLAHVVMFGSFGLFALLGMRIIDRRRQREMGAEAWRDAVARMRAAPFPPPGAAAARGAAALAAASAGVLILMLLHPYFAGVDVLWRFAPGA